MARYSLRPDDLGNPEERWTSRGCSQEIINFGHIPNFNKLLPGDLLLFQPLSAEQDKFSKKIQEEQVARNFAPESVVWTHAAVYIQDVYIVEASIDGWLSNGVRYIPFWDYVGHHNIRVRRPVLRSDLSVEQAQRLRWLIAIEAMAQLPHWYSIRSVIWLKLQKTFGRGVLTPEERGRICTQVYAKAYAKALGEKVVDFFHIQDRDQFSHDLFLPAQLDRSEKLEDVPMDWMKVVKPRDRFSR